jgi:predicted nuclease of predicted toxin-antitoxin system
MARLLLDECVPKRLGRLIERHEVRTVSDMRWTSAPDRNLLRRAAAEDFDVVVTVDRSLPLQQRTRDLTLAIVVLRARSNRYADLVELIPALLESIETIRPGQVVTLTA